MKLTSEILKQFSDLIIETIEAHVKSKEWLKMKTMGLIGLDTQTFKKELGTIKICLPRGSGNTELAAKLLETYKNSIFITSKRIHWELFNEKYPKINKKRIFSVNMTNVGDMGLSSFKGLKIKVVIVDNLSQFSEAQIDKVYRIKSDFFVLIG